MRCRISGTKKPSDCPRLLPFGLLKVERWKNSKACACSFVPRRKMRSDGDSFDADATPPHEWWQSSCVLLLQCLNRKGSMPFCASWFRVQTYMWAVCVCPRSLDCAVWSTGNGNFGEILHKSKLFSCEIRVETFAFVMGPNGLLVACNISRTHAHCLSECYAQEQGRGPKRLGIYFKKTIRNRFSATIQEILCGYDLTRNDAKLHQQ